MAAEIFSTVERRRRWPGEEKVRIMGEALADGASVAAVADRNGVCRSQLYTWLRLAREGKLPGISLNAVKPTRFVPVAIEAAADAPTSSPRVSVVPAGAPPAVAPGSSLPSPSPTVRGRRPAMIEIVLSNGRIMKVDETIDPDAPARLIAVLDDSARLRQDDSARLRQDDSARLRQDDSARSARDGGRSC